MSRTIINVGAVIDATNQINSAKSSVSSAKSSFTQTKNSIDGKIQNRSNIGGRLSTLQRQLSSIDSQIGNIRSVVQSGANLYRSTDDSVETMRQQINASLSTRNAGEPSSKWASYFSVSAEEVKDSSFVDELKKNYGVDDLLAGSGYIGKIYGFVNDIKSAEGLYDYIDTGANIFSFLTNAKKTWNNYKLIGNAVGVKTSTTWWFKNVTGIKPLGRSSTASTWLKRFGNNLTNKTSPFAAQLKDIGKNFTGANGVGKAVSSWASVAVTGVVNFFGNKQEQKESNGTMSDGRVVAETITETAIDTAITLGASAVVGAAVAACTTVALPGVVVTAAAGLVIAGVNAGIKALTGKTGTEWASDFILDTGEKVVNAVGKAAKSVKNAVGGWFKKLKFA